MRKLIFIIVILSMFICVSNAKRKNYGDFYNVEYVRNYDGDTITFNIKDVHPLIGDEITIRVRGIDTPEIKGKCKIEKQKAIEAKIFINKVLTKFRNEGKPVYLKNITRGKYFRIVADVIIGHYNLGEFMIKEGIATKYNGGTKTHNWCE